MLVGVLVFAGLFAGYVLHEHPTVLPAIAGVAALFSIGGVIFAVVKRLNRP
ncbi:hypothetical protein ACIBCO_41225 [Streptomyces violascens]|uniref:hypothetical protein n=1 Tax=Streptomyces violascens TaxID=67381 RepID=UPI003799EFCE